MKQLPSSMSAYIRTKHPGSLSRPGGPSVLKRLIGTFDNLLYLTSSPVFHVSPTPGLLSYIEPSSVKNNFIRRRFLISARF